MKTVYSYACKDYPRMEGCPGRFVAETKDEVLRLVELHASLAHGENPAAWSAADKALLDTLIRGETG